VPQKEGVPGQFHPKQFNDCEDKIKEKAHSTLLGCPNTNHSCDQDQQYLFSLKYSATLSMLNNSFSSPPDTNKTEKNRRHRQHTC